MAGMLDADDKAGISDYLQIQMHVRRSKGYSENPSRIATFADLICNSKLVMRGVHRLGSLSLNNSPSYM